MTEAQRTSLSPSGTHTPIKHVVIVGGGTAGWLCACLLGAEYELSPEGLMVTLIESPDTPPIGVGEGTWPSMRSTLKKIGIGEADFLRSCQAAFKQGTWFRDWTTGCGDAYYHPFSLPAAYSDINLAEHWLQGKFGNGPFASAVTPQTEVCDQCIAPKQLGTPDYAYILNYGYHLDAGRFAELLRSRATEHFGVRHVKAHVTRVLDSVGGDIKGVETNSAGVIEGDLFIDCSGLASLLLGQHFGVAQKPLDRILFNDRALAVQVPYGDDDRIASTTWSTAQTSGWIWDIGLQNRRGVGHVFSSRYSDADQALVQLERYLESNRRPEGLKGLEPRLLTFEPGYRHEFWHRNCVAVGLSAGFVEPLEASALVLVELSARAIAERLPADRRAMDTVAARFNQEFSHRWEQIIEFLKLHYVLSKRSDSPYWIDNRATDTLPDGLQAKLDLWATRPPWHFDESRVEEMFPSASYQYVLYGMGFQTQANTITRRNAAAISERVVTATREVDAQLQKFMRHLPSNRQLLNELATRDFARV